MIGRNVFKVCRISLRNQIAETVERNGKNNIVDQSRTFYLAIA